MLIIFCQCVCNLPIVTALQQKFEEVDFYWDNEVPFVCKQNGPKMLKFQATIASFIKII